MTLLYYRNPGRNTSRIIGACTEEKTSTSERSYLMIIRTYIPVFGLSGCATYKAWRDTKALSQPSLPVRRQATSPLCAIQVSWPPNQSTAPPAGPPATAQVSCPSRSRPSPLPPPGLRAGRNPAHPRINAQRGPRLNQQFRHQLCKS